MWRGRGAGSTRSASAIPGEPTLKERRSTGRMGFEPNFWLLGYMRSEYHTVYRAFSREILERLPLERNSKDFVFDNQMLAQIIWFGYRIGELTCPRNISKGRPPPIFAEVLSPVLAYRRQLQIFASRSGDNIPLLSFRDDGD